jgi:hypothetical protein
VSWVDGHIKGTQAAIFLVLEKHNCKDADLCMKGNVLYLTIPHLRLNRAKRDKRKSSQLWLVHYPEPLAEVNLNN